MDYFKLISLDDYKKIIKDVEKSLTHETEIVDLDDSFMRYSSKDIVSPNNLPGFRRSQVDGYAVISTDTFSALSSPVYLKCKGTLSVDEDASLKSIKSGECYRISTGGMVPKNADAIVMLEHTNKISAETIEITKPVSPSENIISEDEDIRKGEKILSKGDLICSYHIGLLASLGIKNIEVFKKLKISIISTGDEITDIEKPLSPGKIRDVNSYTLFSLIKKYGAIPNRLGIVKDKENQIYEKLRYAMEISDIVLISGGSSVGTRDLTLKVIDRFKNSTILFHGIAIKPGKPTIMAKINDKFVFGLPGQVSSSIVSFFLTVLPLIKKFYMDKTSLPHINVTAGTNIKSILGREEWVKCLLKVEKSGEIINYRVFPIYSKSGVLGSFLKSDGFIIIPSNREGIKEGELVDFLPYQLIL